MTEKIRTKFILILFIVLCGLYPTDCQAHPFHVSMCEIHYNESDKSLEIALKLFVDDLNNCLSKAGIEEQYFGESGELSSADSVLNQYIQKSFTVKVDGQVRDCHYLGKETDQSALWAYLEIPAVDAFSSFSCTNLVCFELFDDQQNIVQLSYQGKTKSLLLHKRNPTDQLNY